MNDELSFKDPHKRQTITLRSVPIDRLTVVEHQRKTRPAHVEHLVSSIERIGFIVPVVAIEGDGNGKNSYVVIDGQHRLEAAREVGIRKVPVLVVPDGLAPRMMNLNVEKDLNIREKATVSLGIYRAFLDSGADLKETDPEIKDSIEVAYYLTLGLAYERGSRLAGSAFEPLLKKCDYFLRQSLEKAYGVREDRAATVLETNSLIKNVIAQAKEMGVWHQYFQYQLISHIDPFRRKRGRQNFDELFEKAIAKLEQLNEEPDRLRRFGGD
jgi:ParB family transcriptional regulator, chromosome partitioning protein